MPGKSELSVQSHCHNEASETKTDGFLLFVGKLYVANTIFKPFTFANPS